MADVHLTPAEAGVLELLLRFGSEYPLGLIARSGGKLSRGSVYVLLARLEGKACVSSEVQPNPPHEQGRPRRYYQVTLTGRQALLKYNAERDLKPLSLAERVEKLEEQARKLTVRLQRVEGERMVLR